MRVFWILHRNRIPCLYYLHFALFSLAMHHVCMRFLNLVATSAVCQDWIGRLKRPSRRSLVAQIPGEGCSTDSETSFSVPSLLSGAGWLASYTTTYLGIPELYTIMDSGFDDLLAPSRDVMNNPFQDPFSQARSSSPDPWASYSTVVPSFNEEALAFGSTTSPTALTHNAFADVGGFQDHQSEDYATHDFRRDEPPEQEEHTPQDEETPPSPADPLDTAAFNAAEAAAEAEEAAAAAASSGLPTGMVTSQSRGFRESISTEAEEPAKPLDPEPSRTPTPPIAAEQTPKPSSPSPERRADVPGRTVGHVSRGSTASFSSSQALHKAEPASVNPLVQPSTLNRSIAGLSIGGETLGGWQGASGGWQTQTTYTVPEPSRTQNHSVSDDDDDDDRPIAQTMAARAASASREGAQRASSVRAALLLPICAFRV